MSGQQDSERCDMYEPTMDALTSLYLSIEACRSAVDAYRSSNAIQDPIEVVDWSAVMWRKTD